LDEKSGQIWKYPGKQVGLFHISEETNQKPAGGFLIAHFKR
jgi:hypothetical protein